MTDTDARRGARRASLSSLVVSALARTDAYRARLVALVVSALALAACRDGRPANRGRLEAIYGLREVAAFAVDLGADSRAKLAAAPRTWVPATFRYRGDSWPVAVRLKGHRSLRRLDQKPSFKISFDRREKGGRFLGLRGLTLNAMVEDPTMMREAIGYRLYREAGVPAPETGYAELTVDGEAFGVYLLVETVDKEFVEDHFDQDEGAIYEGEYGCDLYPGDVDGMERDLGEGDRADLRALAAATAATPPAQLLTGDGARFDDSALAYLAVSAIIGDFDGYRHGHNYRLYHHPAADRWFFIPWGIDRTFFKRLEPYDAGGLVAARCFRDHTCRLAYLGVLRRVLRHYQDLRLDQGVDVIASFLGPSVAADRRRPYDVASMKRARARLRHFLRDRPGDFTSVLSCLDGDRELDRDGDGHGCMDCNDGDPAVHSGRPELCGNQRDDDCSGLPDDAPSCPCPTLEAEGATFALCERPMTWAQAASHCQAAGGALARLDSAAQSIAVHEAAHRLRRERWWIGLADHAEEGRFEWLDRAPVSFAGWAKGQPDNGSCNQDCAALKRDGSGSWQDTHCAQRQPFVCRMP